MNSPMEIAPILRVSREQAWPGSKHAERPNLHYIAGLTPAMTGARAVRFAIGTRVGAIIKDDL